MNNWRLMDRENGNVVVADLELAVGYWSRLRGLQFRAKFPEGKGLLLAPGDSIHTFWVFFAIDVIWLDAQGRVLEVRSRVRPWRLALAPRGAHAVLEIPAGSASVRPGAVLALAGENGARALAALAFLAPRL